MEVQGLEKQNCICKYARNCNLTTLVINESTMAKDVRCICPEQGKCEKVCLNPAKSRLWTVCNDNIEYRISERELIEFERKIGAIQNMALLIIGAGKDNVHEAQNINDAVLSIKRGIKELIPIKKR